MILLSHLIACIMCSYENVHPIIGVRPSGVMIRLADKRSGVLHELHRIFERVEFEGFLEGFARCFPGGHLIRINWGCLPV